MRRKKLRSPRKNRKTGSELTNKLQTIRGRVAARRGTFRVDRETTVTDPEFTIIAHEAVRDALGAVKPNSAKIDTRIVLTSPDIVADQVAELEKQYGPCVIVGDRVFWLEADLELRRRAAEMVIDRANPMPHRIDSARKSRYKILRVDPNKREAVLEELPAQASPPDEPI